MYRKIDFHAHYLSPGYKRFLKEKFNDHADDCPTPAYSIDTTLSTMERQHIDYTIISASAPHFSVAYDASQTAEMTAEVNDYGAEQQEHYPDKIGFAASLPLPYVEESLSEIDRALSKNTVAFTLPTNANGTYLGNPVLDPIMSKLNEHHALVLLHPNEPHPATKNMSSKINIAVMGFFFDTTRAVVNMTVNDIFTKYPNIKFIIPHAGALLPVISDRVALSKKMNSELTDSQVDVPGVMANQYFDVAGKILPYQLPTLLQMVNPNHLLYGTDSPYTPAPLVDHLAKTLADTDVVSEPMKQMIFYDNGKQLLDSLKK